MTSVTVFVDPTTGHFMDDRLFDVSDPTLNRDDQLLPFSRLRDRLAAAGVRIHTADRLRAGRGLGRINHYWSIGLLDGYRDLVGRPGVVLKGFMMFEPPLVAPAMYAALPELTRSFEHVYLHNTLGDGYSLDGVDRSRLHRFHVPQPYPGVVEPYWSAGERLNKIVVIAGNHNPGTARPELYSHRIEAVAALAPLGCVDLYGKGWDRWWSRHSMWLPYWRHRRALMLAYRGACASKLPVLSRYRFALCLENMPMRGYVTEKIFDCFYAGTVPVYQGGEGVEEYLPPGTFIDRQAFGSWREMWTALSRMPDDEVASYRNAARDFLRSPGYLPFFHGLDDSIFDATVREPEVAR